MIPSVAPAPVPATANAEDTGTGGAPPANTATGRPGPGPGPKTGVGRRPAHRLFAAPGAEAMEYDAEPLASDMVPDALVASEEVWANAPLLGCQSRSPPPPIV